MLLKMDVKKTCEYEITFVAFVFYSTPSSVFSQTHTHTHMFSMSTISCTRLFVALFAKYSEMFKLMMIYGFLFFSFENGNVTR